MILSEMKSSKDAITRGTLSGSKCTKIDVGWGFAPDPTGGAYSAPPDPLTGFKGPTSKGKGEGLGRGRGGVGGTNRPPHDKILATPLGTCNRKQLNLLYCEVQEECLSTNSAFLIGPAVFYCRRLNRSYVR